MKRILFLAQLLPLPLDAGPKVRAYYVLRQLAESGHDVTLLCFVRPTDRGSDVQALLRYCRSVETVPMMRSRVKDLRHGAQSLFSRMPFLLLRDQIPDMQRRVQRLVAARSFDAMHVDQLWMAPYAGACGEVPLRILDQHNAVYKVPERMAAQQRNPLLRALLEREAAKLRAYEGSTFRSFDRIVWVSEDDRKAFPAPGNGARGRHQVIPIAVDTTERQPVRRPHPFRVTFLGGIHWPPNAEGIRWFVERAWPTIAEAVPECVLTIIGKGAPAAIGAPHLQRRIDITGYVSDLETYLAETAVFIVPLLAGAGMRVKILDAWAWALPLVTTTVGAEGICTTPGENVLIADEPDAFAGSVIKLLTNRRTAMRLAENGRATVETLYDWRTVYRAWDGVYH